MLTLIVSLTVVDLSTYMIQSALCLYFYYIYLWKPDNVDLAKIQFNKTLFFYILAI